MAAFLFIQSSKDSLRSDGILALSEAFNAIIPRYEGCELKGEPRVLTGVHYCLLYFDIGSNGNGAITAEENDQHLVVCSGAFSAGDRRRVADVAMGYILKDLWDGLREEDGSFAALWLNKESGEVRILNDFLGRKTLRYVDRAGKFAASSNDLLLPLTGLCGVEGMDEVGAVSILSMDFYSGGRSLIRGVKSLTAHEYLVVKNGAISVRQWKNPVDAARSENVGVSRSVQLKKMRQHIGSAIDQGVKQYESVKCDLTGGQDSRALFSAIVSSEHKERVRFEYRGGETSNDCLVARRLATHYGVPFTNQLFEAQSDFEFEKNAEALVFYGNAQVNCKRAFDGIAATASEDELHLSGIGAEFFRGYYYKENILLKKNKSFDWACSGLAKYYVPSDIPGIKPDLHERFRELFRADLEQIAEETSKNGYDVTDFWYLYERFSRWGGAYMGLPWMRDFWAPFSNHQLVRMGMALSAPMGKPPSLIDEIVKKNTPAAYWMPTNNRLIMALPGRYLVKGMDSVIRRICSKVFRKKSARPTSQGNPDRFRADSMAGDSFEALSSVLLTEGNLLSDLFNDGAVEKILDEHRVGAKSRHNLLGNMLTLCIFERMLGRAVDFGREVRL